MKFGKRLESHAVAGWRWYPILLISACGGPPCPTQLFLAVPGAAERCEIQVPAAPDANAVCGDKTMQMCHAVDGRTRYEDCTVTESAACVLRAISSGGRSAVETALQKCGLETVRFVDARQEKKKALHGFVYPLGEGERAVGFDGTGCLVFFNPIRNMRSH